MEIVYDEIIDVLAVSHNFAAGEKYQLRYLLPSFGA